MPLSGKLLIDYFLLTKGAKMLFTDDRFLTAAPLLSDRLRTIPLLPERVRLNKDRVEWQFGAGRYEPTKFQMQLGDTPLTNDLAITIQRQRDTERLNDFFELAFGEETRIKDFVWKWGPLAILPETRELLPDDLWHEPSPEYRTLVETSGNEVKVGPVFSESCCVYSELASSAHAIVRIGMSLNQGIPIESARDLPPQLQQFNMTLNDGAVKCIFQSDAVTEAEVQEDVISQREAIYWYVNRWLQAAGVSPAIGRTVSGEPFVAARCIPDVALQKAWMAAHDAGKPFIFSRWNPHTRQYQDIPVPCPSVLSGLLACEVAAILIRPSGWGLCPCGKMFRKLGRQEYCGKDCTSYRDNRREDNRQAKARFDAKKRKERNSPRSSEEQMGT